MYISAGPPGATRRRSKSNLPCSLFPFASLGTWNLDPQLSQPLDLLNKRARLGSHGKLNDLTDPCALPSGPLKSSKNHWFYV